MISVVIPTLNAEGHIGRLLAQLADHDVQLIISDAMSSDTTLEKALEAGAILAIGAQSRGAQLRRGAFLASSEWLLFLHADCLLPDNWENLLEQHIQNYPGNAGFFSLKYDSPKFSARWTELMVAWRCVTSIFGWGLPYGDQGLLISRDLYDEIGGYPDWPIFEDVKIVEKVGKKRIRNLGGKITTCSKKYETGGFLKRGWRNFKLLRRYKRGDSIENLLRDYT